MFILIFADLYFAPASSINTLIISPEVLNTGLILAIELPEPPVNSPSTERETNALPVYPDQTPNLMDPTNRPNEPVTAGLRSGAGPGMESMTGFDPRVAETQALKRWLPLLEPIIARPDAPDSVKILVRYIKGS